MVSIRLAISAQPTACGQCLLCPYIFMSLLIPGPKSPRKDFDVFLEPLIEELLQLWSGVMTYDAASRTKFNLHAAVLWSINDYLALGTCQDKVQKFIMHVFIATKTHCHGD